MPITKTTLGMYETKQYHGATPTALRQTNMVSWKMDGLNMYFLLKMGFSTAMWGSQMDKTVPNYPGFFSTFEVKCCQDWHVRHPPLLGFSVIHGKQNHPTLRCLQKNMEELRIVKRCFCFKASCCLISARKNTVGLFPRGKKDSQAQVPFYGLGRCPFT